MRARNPESKWSVPLATPHPVDLGKSRRGKPHLAPRVIAPVPCSHSVEKGRPLPVIHLEWCGIDVHAALVDGVSAPGQ